MPVAALAAPLITGALTEAGVGAGLAGVGGILGGAAASAGAGAGLGAITGQGAGAGALSGGLGGLAGGIGGELGNLVGFPGIGGAVGGALGGALGGEISGAGPLMGGIEGLALGGLGQGGAGGFGFGGTSMGTSIAPQTPGANVPSLGGPTNILPNSYGPLGGSGSQLGGSQLASGDVGVGGGGGGGASGNLNPLDVTGSGTGPGGTLTGPPTGWGPAQIGQTTSTGGAVGGNLPFGDPNVGGQANVPGTDYPIAGTGGVPMDGSGAGSGATQGGGFGIGNVLGAAAGLLPGAMQLFGQRQPSALPQYQREAAPLMNTITGATGMQTALSAPTFTGILPPGQQQALEYQRRLGKTAAEGQAAKTGMAGSTMERDAILNNNARIAAEQVNIENTMMQQAGTYAGLAANASNALVSQRLAQDQQYQNALNSLARGLGGLPGSGSNWQPGGNTNPYGTTGSPGATTTQPPAIATAPDTPAYDYGSDYSPSVGGFT